MSYLLIDGESLTALRTLALAKLLAGECLIDSDRIIVIEGSKSGKRWRASLADDFDVILTPLFSDGVPTVPAEVFEAGRQHRYVELIDREEQRRLRKRTEQRQRQESMRDERNKSRGQSRPVICIEEAKAFHSVAEAARWLGIKRFSTVLRAIQKGRMCGRLHWQYADVLLKELEHERANAGVRAVDASGLSAQDRQVLRPNHPGLWEAAEQAMLLRKREQVQALPWRRRSVRNHVGGGETPIFDCMK